MSKERKPKDKRKIAPQRILEGVIDWIVTEAIVNLPPQENQIKMVEWACKLRMNLVHAVRRKDMIAQPQYSKLSYEDKFELLLARAKKAAGDALGIEERKAKAAEVLQNLPPGPPPMPPEDKNEND